MRILFHVLARLPLIVLQGLGNFGGWLLWVTQSSRRRVALINLELCLPQLPLAERERIARASLAHELKTYLETPRVWLGSERALKANLREERGIECLQRGLARGKGVILLTLHQGAFEAAAIPMSERYPFFGLYKPQRGVINELSIRGRGRFGRQMIAAEAGIRKAALPILAQNYGMYYMPDHDPPEGHGIFSPFFGQPAHTPTIVARITRQSGAAVVFMHCERLPWARGYIAHYFEAEPEVYSQNAQVATDAVNRGLEICVRACPEQYWWGYKRFKRRPEGIKRLY